MQFMQRHTVAPDGCSALHDHKRAPWDGGQRGQRLGGGDGRRDDDGANDRFHLFTFLIQDYLSVHLAKDTKKHAMINTPKADSIMLMPLYNPVNSSIPVCEKKIAKLNKIGSNLYEDA